jgi:hypothetical protein
MLPFYITGRGSLFGLVVLTESIIYLATLYSSRLYALCVTRLNLGEGKKLS